MNPFEEGQRVRYTGTPAAPDWMDVPDYYEGVVTFAGAATIEVDGAYQCLWQSWELATPRIPRQLPYDGDEVKYA
jgi:hypothetical protein